MNDNKTPQTIEEENEALLEEIHQKSDSSSPAASRTLWGDAFKRLRAVSLGHGGFCGGGAPRRALPHGHGLECVPLPAGRTLPVPLEGARSAARADVYFSCFCHDRILRNVRTVHKATGEDLRLPPGG